MVDGIFVSKIRYGLQLLGKVRLTGQDPENEDLREIQLVQNKLLRSLNGTKLRDKISTKHLLSKFDMMSVNQLNAQVKLLEIWKALNMDNYPLQVRQQNVPAMGAVTRASQRGRPVEIGKTNLTKWNSYQVIRKQLLESMFCPNAVFFLIIQKIIFRSSLTASSTSARASLPSPSSGSRPGTSWCRSRAASEESCTDRTCLCCRGGKIW